MSLSRFPGRSVWIERLVGQITAGRAGQPFLFAGPEGSGKEMTALEVARLVQCVEPDACRPERRCESCTKALSFQHPDIRWMGPAPAGIDEAGVRNLYEGKRQDPFHLAPFASSAGIAIGDTEHPGPLSVRSLIRFLRLQAFQGRYKVAVVADAHRMSPGAANALLKTLEEPPPQTLIFLLSGSPSAMLPTIRSRCRKVQFDPYGEAELAELLQEIGKADAAASRDLARRADGNARKAMALLSPEAQILDAWAFRIWERLQAGRRGDAHHAADQLHGGALPKELLPADAGRDLKEPTKEPTAKRGRVLQLCEMLGLYYSEALAALARGEAWDPRIAGERRARVAELAVRRRPRTLVADIARLERTKQEIDRNLNIGLCLAVLFEDLIDHVQHDEKSLAGR
ncbi:MAG: hypothetical protein R6X25_16150 [Candidatus Krumholzibacteriia bacterium]